MRLEDEIRQTVFGDPFMKAVLNVLVTADRLGAHANATLKPFGLSKEQYNVLRILRGQHPLPAPLRSVTERMVSRSSNATRLVEKLRAKNLVDRTTCPSNRRQVDILITAEGLALLDAIDPLMQAGGNATGTLSIEEAEQLNLLLDKMRGTP
ncbi:MAG: DNA-binding MarR family transcriptional regulator [Rhodothermales bacterium]|jgi:DNA-binding MarR family transcriptional regulator